MVTVQQSRLDENFVRPVYTSLACGPAVDTRYWPCRRPVPRIFILFIPGNPGLVDYYNDFLTTIHDDNPDAYEIMSVGHVGQSIDFPDHGSQWSTLTAQAQHKIGVVDKIREVYPRHNGTSLVVINHSMGAYVTAQVLKARPDDIDAVYALFPTLSHIAKTPNARRLQLILTYPASIVLPILSQLIYLLLPFSVLHLLVSICTGQAYSSAGSRVSTQLIRGHVVRSCLGLARDEMRSIKDVDLEFLERYCNKIIFYYGSSDGWTPRHLIEEIASAVAGFRPMDGEAKRSANKSHGKFIHCDHNIPHAFCLEQSTLMALKCAEWLRQGFGTE